MKTGNKTELFGHKGKKENFDRVFTIVVPIMENDDRSHCNVYSKLKVCYYRKAFSTSQILGTLVLDHATSAPQLPEMKPLLSTTDTGS